MKEEHQPTPAKAASTTPAMEQHIAILGPICQDNPVAICITNRQAQVFHANQAFLDTLETNPEPADIKGRALHKLFSHKSRRVIDYIEALIDDERSITLQKVLHLGVDNNPIPMQIRVQLLPSTNGQPSEGALITFQEDAGWHQAQYAEDKKVLSARIRQLSTDLMDRQSLLKAMMDHSPFGIALIDNQRRVIQLNHTAEKILDIPRSEARGILCNNLFQCFEHGQRCPVLDDEHNINQQETVCGRPGKTQRTFLRSAVHSRERDEDIIIEAFIDITEMKGAQQAQQAAYRAKDDFFAKMSHELRTPLNAVIGYSELLADDEFPLNPDELKQYASAIQRGGYDLLHLVDQVLDIARINDGVLENDASEIQPELFINELGTTIRPLADKKHNLFTTHFESNIGTVYADPEHLRAVLLNMLSNACKFTNQGEVTLHVQRQIDDTGEWVLFEIEDTGIGLSEEQIQRIFNRFEQADNSATRGFGGSGLGLSIAKDLSELMGGHIAVKSTPGKGSIFTVWLPGQAPTIATDK